MRLCLVGRGITGSPSRSMQEAFLRASGIDGSYEVCDVSDAELPAFVARLRRGDYRGCNVTMPYKERLAAQCDTLEDDAALLGVVNTITVDGAALTGGNTDAAGFERALKVEHLVPAAGFEALVFGAGGAAAAVCLALGRLRASRITVIARRPEAARSIARRLRGVVEIRAAEWQPAAVRPLLERLGAAVNATPVGLSHLPMHPRSLPVSCTVADVRYRPVPVDLVAAARESGHRACDGTEMLLQQGALSFRRWTGRNASMPPARRALHEALE
jgi:shikimate dehydrogenase